MESDARTLSTIHYSLFSAYADGQQGDAGQGNRDDGGHLHMEGGQFILILLVHAAV